MSLRTENILASRRLNSVWLFLVLLLAASACKTIDLRTDYALANNTTADVAKGKELLRAAYLKMGYDKLEQVRSYEVNSVFNWRFPWSVMPMNALPGNKGNDIHFKFSTNDFNGQVTFLEGRKAGKTYGIQSWQDYKLDEGTIETKESKRYNWGLATYHYVIEAPMRLLGADIIRYAGEKEHAGQQYDLVYATWGDDAPHQEHDQWLVYINKATGMIDLTQITINDFFVPVPAGMKGGTILTERKLMANGTYLPSFVTIQLGKPKRQNKHVYTFTLTDYQFDTFPLSVLKPLKNVPEVGDAKIK